MKKVLILGFALFLAVILATSAFANEPGEYVLYGNQYKGSISFGTHGYSWYSEDGSGPLPEIIQELINKIKNKDLINNTTTEEVITPEPLIDSGLQDQLAGEIGDAGEPVIVDGAYDENSSQQGVEEGLWEEYYDSEGNIYHYNTAQWLQDYDSDGQWHFYKDAKGVLHFYYVDPDYDGQWVRYKDENQVVQYRYEVIGLD
ncbi:MAG: hypothetical protein ACOY46_14675 [Bacillota bacterium]